MNMRFGLVALVALALAATPAAAKGKTHATTAPQTTSSTAPDAVPLVEPATLHAYMQGGIKVTIVDVRQPDEFAQGHIAGAVLMPLGDLEATYSKLPKTAKLVVYCRSGHRSAQAVQILQSHGFKDIASLDGGFIAWQAKGY